MRAHRHEFAVAVRAYGTPSKMSWVARLSMGPYATYEWPVIHPQSAVQKNLSFSCRSNTYLEVVAAYTM